MSRTFLPVSYTHLDEYKRQTTTNLDGKFEFAGLSPQKYSLKITYLSYRDKQRTVDVKETITDLGTLVLTEAAQDLKEVQVVGQIQQSQMKGDTTQFNAAAFKTNPDANVEDLIQKMPGIAIVNGCLLYTSRCV